MCLVEAIHDLNLLLELSSKNPAPYQRVGTLISSILMMMMQIAEALEMALDQSIYWANQSETVSPLSCLSSGFQTLFICFWSCVQSFILL